MSKTKVWTAETIAIGSELLLGGRMDTNSLFIADRLAACGVELRYKTIVGDDLSDIVAVLKTAARRARVVIITGGLGPTVDDLTREAVAQATGHRLGRRKAALDEMTGRLAAWGRTPTKAQFRQAMIPAGAAILSNPVGTAPGFALNWKGTFFAALPGCPEKWSRCFATGSPPSSGLDEQSEGDMRHSHDSAGAPHIWRAGVGGGSETGGIASERKCDPTRDLCLSIGGHGVADRAGESDGACHDDATV